MTIQHKGSHAKVAVLGPLGTYTHEAAHKVFGDRVEYEERQTISGMSIHGPFTQAQKLIHIIDTFQAVEDTTYVGVVPQENTIFGNVIETYDALRRAKCGFVKGEITLQVQHCLLVQQGVRLDEIERVLSHEQALGQCQDFLDTFLSNAARVKTPSTSSAARDLLTSPRNCAAICSRICATLFDGLEVLREGIQKQAANFTRFYIIVRDRTTQLPIALQRTESKALLRLQIPPPSSGTHEKDILQYLSPSGLTIGRIDRRPSYNGVPFQNVYFVEVTDALSGLIRAQASKSWPASVEDAVNDIRSMGGEIDLIGLW